MCVPCCPHTSATMYQRCCDCRFFPATNARAGAASQDDGKDAQLPARAAKVEAACAGTANVLLSEPRAGAIMSPIKSGRESSAGHLGAEDAGSQRLQCCCLHRLLRDYMGSTGQTPSACGAVSLIVLQLHASSNQRRSDSASRRCRLQLECYCLLCAQSTWQRSQADAACSVRPARVLSAGAAPAAYFTGLQHQCRRHPAACQGAHARD
jgi:hypothetical protein